MPSPSAETTTVRSQDRPSLAPQDAALDQFERLCSALEELTRLEAKQPLFISPILPAVRQAIRDGGRETMNRLLREMQACAAASAQLQSLSESTLVDWGGDAAPLIARLDQAYHRAARVVAALDAMQLPASGEQGGGHPPDAAKRSSPATATAIASPSEAATAALRPRQTRLSATIDEPAAKPAPRPAVPREAIVAVVPPIAPLKPPSNPAAPPAAFEPGLAVSPRATQTTPCVHPSAAGSRLPGAVVKLADARTAVAGSIDYRCPSCGDCRSIAWDKLQLGKIMQCPGCRCKLTTRRDGQIVEVIKNAQGQWVDRQSRDRLARRQQSQKYRRLTAAAGLALLIGMASGGPQLMRRLSSPAERELPNELAPRGELFAKAWLAGDFRLMRRLTDPAQDRLLFPWYRRNPPPHHDVATPEAADIKVAVDHPPGESSKSVVRVRLSAAQPAGGGVPVELLLAWEERGGHWIFQPAPNPQAGT